MDPPSILIVLSIMTFLPEIGLSSISPLDSSIVPPEPEYKFNVPVFEVIPSVDSPFALIFIICLDNIFIDSLVLYI